MRKVDRNISKLVKEIIFSIIIGLSKVLSKSIKPQKMVIKDKMLVVLAGISTLVSLIDLARHIVQNCNFACKSIPTPHVIYLEKSDTKGH